MQEKNPETHMDAADLISERPEPGIAVLTLNRPAARNALKLSLIRELTRTLDTLAKDPSIAAIVLTGNGTVFCAGHDLKEMTAHRTDADGGRAFFTETMTACASMMQAIVNCPKPVIAAVQGTATAAGCQLVASCDLAVAAESAHFATPGVQIGLFCSSPMVALSRNVSRKHAMEMLLTGEAISADEAAKYGLINRALPAHEVLGEALGMARTIASKSKATVAFGKAAFYRQLEMPLEEAYNYAAGIMVMNMMDENAREGIGAFLEKRPPSWKDA
jgi:enoyl-CoA hydratase/carnithine racemase